jgi:hypothetical protein
LPADPLPFEPLDEALGPGQFDDGDEQLALFAQRRGQFFF